LLWRLLLLLLLVVMLLLVVPVLLLSRVQHPSKAFFQCIVI
jgi:hypothetical protein